jgi:hypothetical protein
MTQGLAALLAAIVEQVGAALIRQADMVVQAAAFLGWKRFGHEGRLHAVTPRQGRDHALQ